MALDEKHLADISPGDSAVDRLRKRNRRIRPWESSKIETPPVITSESGEGKTLSGQDSPGGISPPGLNTQTVPRPLGDPSVRVPEESQDRGGETPRGSTALGASNPEGVPTKGPDTPKSKYPYGRNTRRGQERRGQNYLRVEYPEGTPPSGQSTPGGESRERVLSVDCDGGFDPRPFLTQAHREREWREKGYGEFRIPHRMFEFVQRVTTTRNELLTLNCLMRFSLGFHRSWCEAGYSFIAAWTGISDLTNVRKSVRSLLASGVIRKTREHNCAANEGSIYELPVVEAYLSYLKAKTAPHDNPGGDSPSGSNTPRVNGPKGSGQNALGPTGEIPPKKENSNQNSKKTLSQNISQELASYIEQVKPAAKRESEVFFLQKLLEEYNQSEIEDSLNYVLNFGTLGNGGRCHSPLRYLSTAIEQVRLKVVKLHPTPLPKSVAGDSEPGTEIRNETEGVEALRDFDKLSLSQQETFLSEAARTNSSAGFSPPPIVLRKLAALAWMRARS